MISPAIDAIRVGDVWECFRHAHKWSRVKITKVSDRSIEYQLVRSRGATQREGRGKGRGGSWHLTREVLLRDFVLVHSVEKSVDKGVPPMLDATAFAVPTPTGKTCSNCGKFLEIALFDPFAGNAAKAQPEGRMGICHTCLVAKRAEGIRRANAVKGARAARVNGQAIAEPPPAPEPEPEPEPAPNPLPGERALETARQLIAERDERWAEPRSSIASALLDLAAQADAIEHPPAYKRLYEVVDMAARRGTDAGTVFVIPSDYWLDIQVALEVAAKDIGDHT